MPLLYKSVNINSKLFEIFVDFISERNRLYCGRATHFIVEKQSLYCGKARHFLCKNKKLSCLKVFTFRVKIKIDLDFENRQLHYFVLSSGNHVFVLCLLSSPLLILTHGTSKNFYEITVTTRNLYWLNYWHILDK